MMSLPSASGELFSSFIVSLHTMQDAYQETYEWTFIVVQMMSPGHSHRRETWQPLLLKKLPLPTNLLFRSPPAKLRLLAGDSETNRALELFPLRLLPSFPCDKACPIFRIGRVSLSFFLAGKVSHCNPVSLDGPPTFRRLAPARSAPPHRLRWGHRRSSLRLHP